MGFTENESFQARKNIYCLLDINSDRAIFHEFRIWVISVKIVEEKFMSFSFYSNISCLFQPQLVMKTQQTIFRRLLFRWWYVLLAWLKFLLISKKFHVLFSCLDDRLVHLIGDFFLAPWFACLRSGGNYDRREVVHSRLQQKKLSSHSFKCFRRIIDGEAASQLKTKTAGGLIYSNLSVPPSF